MSRAEQRERETRRPLGESLDSKQASHPASRISSNAHIAIASLGIFLAALDQTVIVTALWPISTDLQIPVTQLDKAAWVITAYLLGYTVALPLMGRVADVYGQRRIYLLALGVFMIGSLLCALAPSLGWLIAARCIQAVGGGAVLPVGMAMCSHLFGQSRIPFMLGILGAVAEAGAVIGPLWGALIMQNLDGALNIVGWRWIFWVNLPLGLLFAALMLRTPALPRFPGKIDWAGAALLGAGLLSLALALSTPGSVGVWAGFNSVDQSGNSELVTPQSIALFASAILFFTGFAFRQRRAADPLFPPALFSRSSWPFVAANLTNLLVGAALIITMVNVPLYVASVLDGTAEQGGLMLLRMTAFIPVGAIAGGLLGVRVTYRWIAVAGLLFTSIGSWEMAGWTLTSADSLTTWVGLAANGLGFGLLISPVTATALQWGGLRRAALSAASVNLSRMVGTLVSLSAVTVLGLRRFKELMSSHPAVLFANPGESAEAFAKRQADYITTYKAATLDVYTSGFLVAALITLVAVAFAIWLRRNPDSDAEAEPIF
ncbi:MAG: MFS transporter [Chloroflexi bacterium]|nr:MFS transporter [Chloroflexota bacterium]